MSDASHSHFEASWKSHFQLARSGKSWMDLFRASLNKKAPEVFYFKGFE